MALCGERDLSDLPSERILAEMEKLLLLPPRPSAGWTGLRKLCAINQLFPAIKNLIDVPQDPEWHPRAMSSFTLLSY